MLLQVDGEEMTGRTQSEAVGVLRRVAAGATVRLVVSRQVISPVSEDGEQDDPFTVPRQLVRAQYSPTGAVEALILILRRINLKTL